MTIKQLEKAIIEADKAYYETGTSTYSDAEYDKLKEQLKEADPTNALLDDLGETLSDTVVKVTHPVPMLSLEKIKEIESTNVDEAYTNVNDWLTSHTAKASTYPQLAGALITVEPKVDGMSAEARYIHGKLVSISTRGNGTDGADITETVKHLFASEINDSQLGNDFLVRGELYISLSEFQRINTEQKEKGLDQYANPRNLCVGVVKAGDVHNRKVSFVVHGFVNLAPTEDTVKTLSSAYTCLKDRGFEVVRLSSFVAAEPDNRYGIYGALASVNAHNKNNEYPYAIDGAVIKYDLLASYDIFGATAHHPNNAVAFKYITEVKKSKVTDIIWQVGAKTGRCTPVAIIEPVLIAGSIVERVSLSNAGLLESKGIAIGCSVDVTKANEIIPFIKHVYDPQIIVLTPTKSCPCCAKPMDLELGSKATTKHYVCANVSCAGKVTASLKSSLAHSGIYVEGIGDEICKAFIDKNPQLQFIDILMGDMENYPDSLSALQKLNLFNSMKEARNAYLMDWIKAWQFSGIAAGSAEKIGQVCKDWNTFVSMLKDATSALHSVLTKRNVESILVSIDSCDAKMQEYNLNPKSNNLVKSGGCLEGLTFVVTGSFQTGRSAIEKNIKDNGGRLTNAVSGKTNYLVAGENVGASKTNKAKSTGTSILTEDEYYELVNTHSK